MSDLRIRKVANGYVVTSAGQFQDNYSPGPPEDWRVFETFEGLSEYLRKALVQGHVPAPEHLR